MNSVDRELDGELTEKALIDGIGMFVEVLYALPLWQDFALVEFTQLACDDRVQRDFVESNCKMKIAATTQELVVV